MRKNISDALVERACEIYDDYGYEGAYEVGKKLNYKKRLLFDYKIKCKMIGEKYLEMFAFSEYEKEFISKLIDRNELKYILNNIYEIIRDSDSLKDNLLSYLKSNINNITSKNYSCIEDAITRSILGYSSNIREDDLISLRNILTDVSKRENASLLDIRRVGYLANSKSYKIGNKVVKIGFQHYSDDNFVSNRFIMPYYNGFVGRNYVNISDYLVPAKDVSDEEVYSVYKDLRNQGIVWLYPDKSDLARINKYIAYKNGLKENDLVVINANNLAYDHDLERISDYDFLLEGHILERRKEFDIRYNSKKRVLKK